MDRTEAALPRSGPTQAQQSLNDVQQFIATTLQLVEPGSWTAHDDLAELADTTPNEVTDFLASGQVKLPTSYRVLHADGSIPAEGMLNANYRGTDLRRRLAGEGIEFDANGQASQDQRLTATALKTLLVGHRQLLQRPRPVRANVAALPGLSRSSWLSR